MTQVQTWITDNPAHVFARKVLIYPTLFVRDRDTPFNDWMVSILKDDEIQWMKCKSILSYKEGEQALSWDKLGQAASSPNVIISTVRFNAREVLVTRQDRFRARSDILSSVLSFSPHELIRDEWVHAWTDFKNEPASDIEARGLFIRHTLRLNNSSIVALCRDESHNGHYLTYLMPRTGMDKSRLQNMEWARIIPQMKLPVSPDVINFGVVQLKGYHAPLMLFGGMDKNENPVTTCQFYNVHTERAMAPRLALLKTARFDAVGLTLPNGDVLIAGGYAKNDTKRDVLQSVELLQFGSDMTSTTVVGVDIKEDIPMTSIISGHSNPLLTQLDVNTVLFLLPYESRMIKLQRRSTDESWLDAKWTVEEAWMPSSTSDIFKENHRIITVTSM